MSIFRRFSLSIGCTLRPVVLCVSLLGLTSCFIGKYAFEMSRNYRPVYNPGGHLFEEDEDFVRSYELYKKRREDLQNTGDSAVHVEKKKRLTDAEKRKVVGKLRRHGVKVATADDKGDMVNNEGIDLSRVKGARFIDVDLNEIAKLKAKDRTKVDVAKADEQNVEEKGISDQKESLREEEGAAPQLREEVRGQEAGAAADNEGQQHESEDDELEPGTTHDEGEDFLPSGEEGEDQQYVDEDELEPGTTHDKGKDFLPSEEENEDQQYVDEDELKPGTTHDKGKDFLPSEEEDEDQQYVDEDELEPGTTHDEGEDFLPSGEEGEDQQYVDEDEIKPGTAYDEGEGFLSSEEEIEHVANTGSGADSVLNSSDNGGEGSHISSGYLGSYSSACCSGTGGGFYFSIDDECCDVDGEVSCDSDEGYIFGNR